MHRVFFATQNKHKQREITQLLEAIPTLEVVFVDHFPDLATFDPEETGQTLHQNAELKARAFASKTHVPTISEDSGLEVTALAGKPGVHSKRFFPGSDTDRNHEILRQLAGETNREAQFRSVFCYYDPVTNQTTFFEGKVAGSIATKVSGNNGFGYDPIFTPEGYNQTFAELGERVKNKLSHRALAMNQVIAFLKSRYT
jgi:XTP/dITP diphosphohydrolase